MAMLSPYLPITYVNVNITVSKQKTGNGHVNNQTDKIQ